MGKVVALVVVLGLAGCTAAPEREPAFPSALPTRPAPPATALDGASQPVADPVYPEYGNPALDVRHYDLALDWQPGTGTLTGRATLTIAIMAPVSEIALDFARTYQIKSASIDGAAAAPARRDRDGDLVLPAGAPLAVGRVVTTVIEYEGQPRALPFPGVRRDAASIGARSESSGVLFSLQEPYGAHTWFPCSDQPSDKALFDVAITVPPGWAGVSSGRLTGVEANTYRWKGTEPNATYVVALAVDRFQRSDATGPHGLPVSYWVPGDLAGRMLPVLRRTPSMIEWLERRFGPYPFATAGVVVVPAPTAMETQSMVTMGPIAGQAGEGVLLHELAHQWFGDSVTPRTWRDLWLNEGFATYAQLLYEAEHFGRNLQGAMRRLHREDTADRQRAGPPSRYDPKLFGEHNVYFGPALMLHELRLRLGDGAFFALLHDWAQHHRHTNQDRASFSAFVGRPDLVAIVDKWLDAPTTPALPE
jgi:aminopeptidase N